MIELHKSQDRFASSFDWLESRHGFSFGHHADPTRMGHGPLRVVNEDWIAPRSGFPAHPHRDMEILTYVLSGRLTHRDSEGHRAELEHGRVQLMHAGRGILHSEYNLEPETQLHLLQIWLEPAELGTEPGHEELDFALTPGQPHVLVSERAALGGLAIRQDATVSALALDAGSDFTWRVPEGRRGWVQWARGAGSAGGHGCEGGDALALTGPETLRLEASAESELLLFDLP